MNKDALSTHNFLASYILVGLTLSINLLSDYLDRSAPITARKPPS